MNQAAQQISAGKLSISATIKPEFQQILTPPALAFVESLVGKFAGLRSELLDKRKLRQQEFDSGKLPDFLTCNDVVHNGDWKVAALPQDLLDRRVEITGPVERKMVINALNSGAKVFMADFEDSLTPAWDNLLDGQINLRDAVNRSIAFTSDEGKSYKLNEKTAVLIVRPRGWHLDERHVTLGGKAIPGALFDFGLYLFHNHAELQKRNTGPYFYLPKLENHLEARLWADVFTFAEEYLGMAKSTIRATVLIEVITSVFEMEEILYELRDYAAGLNCGRWDYIYSYIKKLNLHNDRVLPERGQVTMTTNFLRSYSRLLIKTCHKRGAFAMGGMSAFIPIKSDVEANEKAINAVRADKEREAGDGHDGTWVAHPGLVPVALEIFNKHLGDKPNQLDKQLPDFQTTQADLLEVPEGTVSETGLRNNISVSLQYIESWLRGLGCVPIFNLMEDAATAEISRSQIWQWLRYSRQLVDGRVINKQLVDAIITEELNKVAQPISGGKFTEARKLLEQLIYAPVYEEFLTLPAYRMV
jgi:malate synthase